MDLSATIASTAIVLGVILTAGYAFGEAGSEPTQQQRIEARETQRKAELEEQEKRKIAYRRACEKRNKTEEEQQACRDAYRRLHTGS
jgi:uncharacterized protein HemX